MTTWIVQVSAGVGPAEVREFVAQLARELQAQCVAAGLTVQSVAIQGEEDAPRSVELVVRGPAREVLAGCVGTHVLVARSARRGRRARKRWFAGVSIHAHEPRGAPLAELRPCDVEVTAARAGGPGGQHVNTTDSAVRVRHAPSGITVRVATERSQHRNRSVAMARLRVLLGEREERARTSQTRQLRAAHYQLERGAAVQAWFIDERTRRLHRQ